MSEAAGHSRAGPPAEGGGRGRPLDPGLEEKPFRLVKSFSAAAVGLIFAMALTLAAVVSRQAEKMISNQVEDDTVKLMENLNHQMFYGFLFPARLRFGRIQLRHPEQQALLNEVITRTIHGFDIQRVVIYDPGGEVVYATDQTLLQSTVDDVDSFNRAAALYWAHYSRNLWLHLQDVWLYCLKFVVERARDPEYVPPDPRRFLRRPGPPLSAPGVLGGPRPASPYVWPGLEGGPLASEGGPPAGYAPPDLYDLFQARPGEALLGPPWNRASRAARPEENLFNWFWSWLQNANRLPRRPVTDEAFMDLLRSQTVFRQAGGRRLWLNFFPRGDFSLRSYKALENYGTRGLSGVLEIDRDLTREYRQIARLQYFALGVAALLSLILTLALRWVVGRGEAALTRRNLERQALTRRLGQAERLAGLGSMVATVAHEIRNPLGIIHSTADVLNRFLAAEPDKARLARAIVEEADRLSEVVSEFLDFARPPEPKLARVVVEEILEEVLASLEVTLARASVELRTDFRSEPTPTLADARMLHRAFLNLFLNAVQAMDEGGLLTVKTSLAAGGPAGDRLLVTIGDTGPGLSAEAALKIFSPFFTTKAKGTGLGLVIVRNIVEAHGGTLELVSGRDPGGRSAAGLTVVLSLKI